MGYNATVVVCLDHIDSFGKSPLFGQDLEHAILKCNGRNTPIDGPYGTVVVETHHADHLVPVIVGGNSGHAIPAYVGIDSNELLEDSNVRVLKEMARVLGYRISKIPTPR